MQTSLHLAVKNEDIEIIKLLLNCKKINVNEKDGIQFFIIIQFQNKNL